MNPSFLGLEIERLSPREEPFLQRDFSAWKGEGAALGGGLPRSEPLASFLFLIVSYILLTFVLFPSPRRKLSLLPLDRAGRFDSHAPNESSVAQI